MHRKVVAALVAALALGVASCGGSEETLSRQEVVRRLEAACRQAQERGQQASRDARGPDAFFLAVLAGQRHLTRAVEGIEASDDVADEVATLKSSLAERTGLVADVAETPRAEQERAMQAASDRIDAASRRAEAAFRRLGVRGCQ